MSNLSVKNMYGTMPKSLTQEVMVRSRFEDPDVQRERRNLTQSKSVSELARINGLSDFPVPATLERLIGGRGGKKDQDAIRYIEKIYHIFFILSQPLKSHLQPRRNRH